MNSYCSDWIGESGSQDFQLPNLPHQTPDVKTLHSQQITWDQEQAKYGRYKQSPSQNLDIPCYVGLEWAVYFTAARLIEEYINYENGNL